MDRYWENKIQYLAITPPCIWHNYSFQSNVPIDKGRKERTLKIRIRKEYFNLIDKLNKLIYDIKYG